MKVEEQIIKDWANWMVQIGVGYDFDPGVPIPAYMRDHLVEAWYQKEKESGGHDTLQDYYEDLSLELGWK